MSGKTTDFKLNVVRLDGRFIGHAALTFKILEASNSIDVGSVCMVFVCALTVQKAARNKIGIRCWIFIDVSIKAHPPVLC